MYIYTRIHLHTSHVHLLTQIVIVLTGAISVERGILPGSKGCVVLGASCAVTVPVITDTGTDAAVKVADTPDGPCDCGHVHIYAYEHQY